MFNYLTHPLKGYDFGTIGAVTQSTQKELDQPTRWSLQRLVTRGDTVESPAIALVLGPPSEDNYPARPWS